MGNENSSGLKVVLTVVIMLLLSCCGYIGYQLYTNAEEQKVEQSVDVITNISEEVSLEQAMANWQDERYLNECMDIYYALPSVIIKELFVKCGTLADVETYIEEYRKNMSYYISLQIKEQFNNSDLPKLTGPDANNIKEIEVKPIMKAPEPVPSIPIVSADSAKK